MFLYEIAHAIVSDRLGIVDLLKSEKFALSKQCDDEELFRVILENKTNDKIVTGIIEVLKKYPYYNHCLHCFEKIQGIYDRGVIINKELSGKQL